MEGKYVIYKNDLKYRDSRNLDYDRINWDENDIKHLVKINHDSVEYRINESKGTDYTYMDLEMTGLRTLPFIHNNVRHLFLSNNNLSGTIDLSLLKNLEICDIASNQVTSLIIPESLIELSACNNKLVSLNETHNLKRLKISDNCISDIRINRNSEILEISNNKLNSYDFSNFTSLKKLIIHTNPLKFIKMPPNCTYVDLSETGIDGLDNLFMVEHLVLNNCRNISRIPLSDNLKTLELIETPIQKLYFYKNFELILLQLNLTKSISSKYKQSNANIQIRKNKFLVISKGVEIYDENYKTQNNAI